MNSLFYLALICCGIWEATSVIVLDSGLIVDNGMPIYNREFILDGSSQTISYPSGGFITGDFRITKVKISSEKPNGLIVRIKEGGVGTHLAKIQLNGRSGTKFRLTINAAFEGICTEKTTIDDWNRITFQIFCQPVF